MVHEPTRAEALPERRFFCFGLGYSALVLARRLLAQGWSVAGTCQSRARQSQLRNLGIDAFLMDQDHPLPAGTLAGVTHLLSSVPPNEDGDPVLRTHRADIETMGGLLWVGYLSTTGVYGDSGGRWVDETTPRNPTSSRARYRVAAENGWLGLIAKGVPVRLFRLAGIYGPGRSALDQVRAGQARRVVKPGHKFGRIHVDDIAETLLTSMDLGADPKGNTVYNLCDDEPCGSADVVTYACKLLGVEPPPEQPFAEIAPIMSALGRSFWADNRLVSNARAQRDLDLRLLYPNYRAGLDAIFAQEGPTKHA